MSKDYVLVTPAKDEAAFLPRLIDSIVNQTATPRLWIIVDDGSSDDTGRLATEAQSSHPWIKAITVPAGAPRAFGAKSRAFAKAMPLLEQVPFSFVGNLDADITLPHDYYDAMITRMNREPTLGVASGVCFERSGKEFRCITLSTDHAVGAVQLFRRECFQAIGGYRSVSVGGVDSIAELTAKMLGWSAQSFSDLPVYHHKPVDSALGRSALKICVRAGMTDYHIGTHPVFALVKAVRRWRAAPYGISAVVRWGAYLSLWAKNVPRDAGPELSAFVARNQMETLKLVLLRRKRRFTPTAGPKPL